MKQIEITKEIQEFLKSQGFELIDLSNFKLKLKKGQEEKYCKAQIEFLKNKGFEISEKELKYLDYNDIKNIGHLIAKKILGNKLSCFEVIESWNNQFKSNLSRFKENCKARKKDINVQYLLIYNEKNKRIEMIDASLLWFKYCFEELEDKSVYIIKREEALAMKRKYYSNTFVKFEIVKEIQHRELFLLTSKFDYKIKSVRYIPVFTLDFLNYYLKQYEFDKKLANMYMSVALFKDNAIPNFTFNLKKRAETSEYIEFLKTFNNRLKGMDLFIDIDSGHDWKKGLSEVLEIKKIYDNFKVPYYIIASSFKGFQIKTPSNYMPEFHKFRNKLDSNETDIELLLKKIEELVFQIKEIHYLPSIDMSVYVTNRVCKVPYSYNYDNAICLPLSDEQLKSFNPKILDMDYVLKHNIIKNRGLLIRDFGLSDNQLKENVKKLFDYYKITYIVALEGLNLNKKN